MRPRQRSFVYVFGLLLAAMLAAPLFVLPLTSSAALALAAGGLAAMLLAGRWFTRTLTAELVYRVKGDTLSVPGHFGPHVLPLTGATFTVGPLTRAWRVAGSAIPGLLLGTFKSGGRTVHLAARDLENGVRIERGSAVYVTPADVDAFCAALQRAGAVRGE